MNNSQIRKKLKQIKSMVKKANNEQELLKALDVFGEVDKVKFDHTLQVVLGLSLLSILSYSLYFYFNGNIYDDVILGFDSEDCYLGLNIVLGIITLIPFISLFSDTNSISSLSDLIVHKDVMFDNNIKSVEFDGSKEYKKLSKQFSMFNVGDCSHKITELSKYTYENDTYLLYTFFYQTRHTRTVSNGKTTTTQTYYVDHYRYGIIKDTSIDFDLGLNTSNGLSEKWETASSDFEKRFSVYISDKMKSVKLLKPSIILELIELDNHFTDLKIAISDSKLCFMFDDSNTVSYNNKYDLSTPKLFKKELEGILKVPKLYKLRDFINKFEDASVNNFKQESL
jgi:hypothetical protein